MAELLPNTDLDAIANPGERAVAEALLEQSPSSWRIVYSKFWLWRDTRYNSSRYREGEIDFVVIVPSKGIICIEVKSAKRYRRTDGGIWQRFDEDEQRWISYPKSPWEQAVTNKHALVRVLCDKIGRHRLDCGYSAAVVFPRCFRRGELPAGEDDPTLVIDGSGMGTIVETLHAALDEWWPGEGDTRSIEAAMCPSATSFCDSLAVDCDRRNRKLIRLTEQQARVLGGLRLNKAVQVLGGAGTGKTVLAMELARRAVGQGQRVLYLCFSRKLAFWVSEAAGLRSFVASNFHRLAHQYAKSARLPWPERPDDTFWSTDVSVTFLDAIERLGVHSQFDTVIVDEVQDFVNEWLIPVCEVWNEEGQLVLFGDENQTVFGGEFIGHRQLVHYVLQTNCRNTREIARACARVLRDANVRSDDASLADLPSGHVPRWINGGEIANRRSATIGQVEQWIAGGLKKNQIAVLSPWAEDNCLGMTSDDVVIDGIPFTRSLDVWRASSACLFETIRGFKGLEADALVVTDIPTPDESPAFTVQDAYVAFSRAKHELVAVATCNGAARSLARWFAPES